MPMLDAWLNDRTTQFKKQDMFLSACFICLTFILVENSAHAEEPGKIVQSSYSVLETADFNSSLNAQSDVKQTQFRKRKKARKKKAENNQQVNYSQFVKVLSKGKSKRSAKKQGLAALPLSQLSPEKQAKARKVLNKISIYRELPTISVQTNHDVYRYFVKNPEIAVEIWRVMGISKFQMWQVDSNTYGADAGDGSKGNIDVLYRSPTECLLVCDGVYDSPFLVKPIAAKALMYLQATYHYDENNNQIVTHKMRLFLSFPSQTIVTAARLISPVSNMIIDKNFHEVSLFLHMMTRSMSEHPEWVENLTDKMDRVMEVRRQQLLKLTAKVYQDNKKLKMAQALGNSPVPTRVASKKRTTAQR